MNNFGLYSLKLKSTRNLKIFYIIFKELELYIQILDLDIYFNIYAY